MSKSRWGHFRWKLLCLMSLGQVACMIPGGKVVRIPTSRDQVMKDVVFTPEKWPAQLRADIYRPDLTGSAPAILLIHGGGWTGGDKRSQMNGIARKLVRHGYVVVNATYRTTPEWRFPAQVDDLREAIRWMKRNAGNYGIDPEKIAVFGYSAGGHLAALVGMMDPPPDIQIRAMVIGGGPSDLMLYPGGDLVPMLIGGSRSQMPERFRQASPVNHVSRESPPAFIYHGEWDRLVPPEHVIRLQQAFVAHDVAHQIHWLPGRDHIGAFVVPGSSISKAISFLDERMK